MNSLIREGLLNIVANPLQSTLLAVASLAAALVLTVGSHAELSTIAATDRENVAQGIYIYRVQTAAPVSAAACDELRYSTGIADSGAVLAQSFGRIQELPGNTISLTTATTGYLRIVWNVDAEASSQVGAGSSTAAAFGLREGSDVTFTYATGDHVRLEVRNSLPATERVNGSNQTLVVPSAPQGTVRECLVEAEPGAMAAVATYLKATFGAEAAIAPLFNPPKGQTTETLLHNRLSVWNPILIPILLGILATMSHNSRRVETALYRLLGARRRDLLLMAYVEASIVVFTPAAVGIGAVCLFVVTNTSVESIEASNLSNDIARAWILILLIPLITSRGPGRQRALAWLRGQ